MMNVITRRKQDANYLCCDAANILAVPSGLFINLIDENPSNSLIAVGM
jgi:hypothetical protein